jgi:hypothetical protein
MRFFSRRPSAAFVVAVFALCFALVGSAIAGTDASKKALSKSQVKKIAKKQANKAINKAAPGLSVAHATSADTATSATSATTATNANSPSVYAHVNITGASNPNVDESRSKGLTDADFHDTGGPGIYCVNLPAYKTFSAAVDEPITTFAGGINVIVLPDDINACNSAGFGPANTIIEVVDSSPAPTADDFDIQLGT